MLRYWTTRYLITLCIGLIVIGIVSALFIRHFTIEHRLNNTIFMAEQLADRIVNMHEGRLVPREEDLPSRGLEERFNYTYYIVDNDGVIISSSRFLGPRVSNILPAAIVNNEKQVQKIQSDAQTRTNLYLVKAPIELNDIRLGWVIVTQPAEEIEEVNQEYGLLAIMLVSLALLGWVAIYFVSRRVSAPINHVAQAAKKIQAGEYNVELHDDVNEQEVYELVHSFKDMASRLEQLEGLRTELLAGVTHELKTPVTSISGLLQALKDDVVTGEDAKEFLEISLKETARMQKMIGDLLEFNTFAVNQFSVKKTPHSINDLMEELTHYWKVTQEDERINLVVDLVEEDIEVEVDEVRLQQIMTNLLNNGKQSMECGGTIQVMLKKQPSNVEIFVKDEGVGIPEGEQELVFERFYRGNNKKFKVRGLGLGLPFSKMLAKAMDGDLLLVESSSNGTSFKVVLPYNNNK